MIWEALQYLMTPTALPYARPMGFLREAIATAARSRRCRQDWAAHYARCRAVLMADAKACTRHRKALILGAGTLNDIPLAELSALFDEVYLVDLVFLPAARKQARRFANVCLIEADVTESLHTFYRGCARVSAPKRWLDDAAIDWVVSLNLLTQLPYLPLAWLARRNLLDDAAEQALAQALLQAHLHYLQQFEAAVTLIADREAQRVDRQGQCLHSFELWWGVTPLPVDECWRWTMAPNGELSHDFAQIHCVGVTRWPPARLTTRPVDF